MKLFKISVNFCGGCNPHINRGKITNKVVNTLSEELTIAAETIVYNADNADFFIYLSGCTANCAQKDSEKYQSKYIAVSGEMINGITATEDCLAELIVAKVREYFEGLANRVSEKSS